MSLTINHNLMALNTSRNLSTHYGNLATSTRRLSSGLRVGTAADDAAGLAVRELMRADIASLGQGIRNVGDAISMIQVADGALQVIDEKLIRMKELATQAATGTYTSDQRAIINAEFQQMKAEIDRIANATNFNGIKLLNGDCSGTHNGYALKQLGSAKIHFGTKNDENADYYFINIDSCTTSKMFNITNNGEHDRILHTIYGYNTAGNSYVSKVDMEILNEDKISETGQFTIAYKVGTPRVMGDGADKECWIEVGSPDIITSFFQNYQVYYHSLHDEWYVSTPGSPYENAVVSHHANGCAINLDNVDGADVYIHFAKPLTGDTLIIFNLYPNWGIEDYGPYPQATIHELPPIIERNIRFGIDFDGDGSTDLVGTVVNEGPGSTYNVVATFDIREAQSDLEHSTNQIDIQDFNIKTQHNAQQMLDKINTAIVYKDSVRAHLGAMQNRLENTATNLQIQAENLQAAESRISDVDVALEMTNLVKNQILAQGATAMLAQANTLPQMALELIQG